MYSVCIILKSYAIWLILSVHEKATIRVCKYSVRKSKNHLKVLYIYNVIFVWVLFNN